MALPDYSAPNTILLKDRYGYREERPAKDGSIKPGHIIKGDGAGNYEINDQASGTDAIFQIAIEDALQSKTIIDAYATGKTVFSYIAKSGDRVYVRVPAGAAAIALDDQLQFNNTGCMIKQTGAGIPKAVALEALDNSGGGSEVFIRAEVL